MLKKLFFVLFLSFAGSLVSVDNPLVINPAVSVNPDFGVFSTSIPIVGVNDDGYMVTYATFERGVGGTQSSFSFSSDGETWGAGLITMPGQTQRTIWNTGNSSGFLLGFLYPPPGGISTSAQSSFSADQGSNWTAFTVIDAGPSVFSASLVPVITVTGGHIASWTESSRNFVSFSNDNGSTWSAASQIGTSISVNTSAMLGFNSSGLLATWVNTTGSTATASFSSDLGATWSPEVTIATGVGGEVFCAPNETGFIAVWVDFNTSEVLSSFSSDQGVTWSSPSTVSSDVSANTNTRPFVTSTEEGFIATWIDSSGNGSASFSDDNGTTWSDPVLVSDDGSVDVSNKTLINVVCDGSSCVFTWRQTGTSNVMVNLASMSASDVNPPTAISGAQKKNDFGMQFELFNLVTWGPSNASNLSGYNVYRNGVKIATLSSDRLFFEDHNQPRGVQETYRVTAFDSGGSESSPLTVVVNPL